MKGKAWQWWAWRILLFLLIAGAIGAYNKPVQSEQAQSTSMRNGFVSGCKQEASKYPTLDADYYCECAVNKMETLYPDFTTNTDRINRILKDGYNPTETDALVSCVKEVTAA